MEPYAGNSGAIKVYRFFSLSFRWFYDLWVLMGLLEGVIGCVFGLLLL